MAQSEKVPDPAQPRERVPLDVPLRWLARSLAALAVLSSFALMYVGAAPLLGRWSAPAGGAAARGWTLLAARPLSALPLLVTGVAYIFMQAIVRPRALELVKRLMLAFAFLLWGVVQLMPAGDLATELGNVVIALYVIDLGLIVWTESQRRAPGPRAEAKADQDVAL